MSASDKRGMPTGLGNRVLQRAHRRNPYVGSFQPPSHRPGFCIPAEPRDESRLPANRGLVGYHRHAPPSIAIDIGKQYTSTSITQCNGLKSILDAKSPACRTSFSLWSGAGGTQPRALLTQVQISSEDGPRPSVCAICSCAIVCKEDGILFPCKHVTHLWCGKRDLGCPRCEQGSCCQQEKDKKEITPSISANAFLHVGQLLMQKEQKNSTSRTPLSSSSLPPPSTSPSLSPLLQPSVQPPLQPAASAAPKRSPLSQLPQEQQKQGNPMPYHQLPSWAPTTKINGRRLHSTTKLNIEKSGIALMMMFAAAAAIDSDFSVANG